MDEKTVRFRVERHQDKIEIELVSGQDSATFTAPADSFVEFDQALHAAILESQEWDRVQEEIR